MRVAAVVLTKDEEQRVEECLKHLKPSVSYLLVLDDESKDRTVEIAEKTADKVVVRHVEPDFSACRNYAQRLVPKWCPWILVCDVDERFDPYWLSQLPASGDPGINCMRFPRINLPTPDLTWPDYQVRFYRNKPDYVWRHEGLGKDVLYSRKAGKRLDQLEGVTTLEYCPILHLPRRTDITRPWW